VIKGGENFGTSWERKNIITEGHKGDIVVGPTVHPWYTVCHYSRPSSFFQIIRNLYNYEYILYDTHRVKIFLLFYILF
jgi:hypothetical protein